MSEIKCTGYSALPRAGICVAATRSPGMVLDCSSEVPLSSTAGRHGCVCRHVLPAPGSSPSPQEKHLSSREEETRGGIWAVPGGGWGATCEGCSAAMYSSPLRRARAVGRSRTSCPVQKPEPAKPAGMLPRCRWALSRASDPRRTALKIHQLSSSWLSTARVSNQIEEESGEKNAGIIPGIGKRDALSGALGRPDSPAAGTLSCHPGPAGKGPGEGCKGFPKRSWRKALGNSLEGGGWDWRHPYLWQ